MSLFTSSREKKLWGWAFLVFSAIFATLFLGQPLARYFGNQDIQAMIFAFVMIVVGTTILIHALKTKPGKVELVVILGLSAVYIMFFLRLGLPERSHLMEYSVLAIFIHKAIMERVSQGKKIRGPALVSFLIAFLIGVLDEGIQFFLPQRVFDPVDILFNGFATAMAIGTFKVLRWVRKKRET